MAYKSTPIMTHKQLYETKKLERPHTLKEFFWFQTYALVRMCGLMYVAYPF